MDHLLRNNGTGLTDSTHSSSSSSSAERYALDEGDDRPILLYKYRGGLQTSSQRDLCAWLDKGKIPSSSRLPDPRKWCGCSIRIDIQTKKRCSHDSRLLNTPFTHAPGGTTWPNALKNKDLLTSTDEKLRLTRKPIPRMTSYVDVKRHDLYTTNEKCAYAKLPNYDSNLASIKIPSNAYWSRLILGNYEELYIVSPESSPASSVADDDSRRTSPTSTWDREGTDESRLETLVEEDAKS